MSSPFPPAPPLYGDWIDKSDAADMTSKYRIAFPDMPVSATFDRSFLEDLLDGVDTQRIRVYFGLDGKGKTTAILTAVDSSDIDILSKGIVEYGNHQNSNPL